MANQTDDPTYQTYIGKHLLVGLTYLNPDESMREKVQLHGHIIAIDESCVTMRLHGSDEICTLPPEPERFEPAEPGEYRLRATGEVVVDPDLLAYWVIHPAARDKDDRA